MEAEPMVHTYIRRVGTVLAAGVALTCLTGCGASSPTSPVTAPAIAIARVDLWRVTLTPIPGDSTYYAVRFRASERSGLSDAIIKAVVVNTPYGQERFDEDCWRSTIRVETGNTLATFDDGWSSLGSCAPRALPVAGLTVTVWFADSAGTIGWAAAPIPKS